MTFTNKNISVQCISDHLKKNSFFNLLHPKADRITNPVFVYKFVFPFKKKINIFLPLPARTGK